MNVSKTKKYLKIADRIIKYTNLISNEVDKMVNFIEKLEEDNDRLKNQKNVKKKSK